MRREFCERRCVFALDAIMPRLAVELLCPECEREEVVGDLRELAFFAIPFPLEEGARAAMLGDLLL